LITHDYPNWLIYLNQSVYISQILIFFGLQDIAPVSTLFSVKHDLFIIQFPQSKAKKHTYKKYARNIYFLSLVGSFLFATQTYPNIQFAVSLIAQFGGNHGIVHLEARKRVLYYLKGTIDLDLVLRRHSQSGFDLMEWINSNWAQDLDNYHLTSGSVFDVREGVISWSPRKQPTVAMSLVEVEYIVLANVTRKAIWLCILLEELNFS